MHILGPVQFAAIVHHVAAVNLLNEDHRDARPVGSINDRPRAFHVLAVAGHDGTSRHMIHEGALLDIDNDQDGVSDKGGLARHEASFQVRDWSAPIRRGRSPQRATAEKTTMETAINATAATAIVGV